MINQNQNQANKEHFNKLQFLNNIIVIYESKNTKKTKKKQTTLGIKGLSSCYTERTDENSAFVDIFQQSYFDRITVKISMV